MKNLSFLIAVLCLSVGFLQAQSVDDILKEYYANTGADNWEKYTSMRFQGKSVTQGMELETTVISMRPNLQKVEVNIMDKRFVEAYDGEVAWMINPFMGSMDPQKKTEEESVEAAQNMFEDELINYEEKGHTITLEGTEEVDGAETFKLKLVKENGDEVYYFLDSEYFVPVMMRSYAKTGQMKGQPVEVYFSDYEEVEDVMIARSIEQKMNGQTLMQMTAENIELNPEDVKKEDFAFPGKE